MLFRKIEAQIEDHLKSDSHAIMLIDGARQVGKTYIIRHVGSIWWRTMSGPVCSPTQKRLRISIWPSACWLEIG